MEDQTLYVVMTRKFDLTTLSRGPWEQDSDPMPGREAALIVLAHWNMKRPARRMAVNAPPIEGERGQVIPFQPRR